MSGAERVEPEVSPTPAEKKKKKNPETITHRDARIHTHVHADTRSRCALANCSIHLLEKHWNLNNPPVMKDFDAFIKD